METIILWVEMLETFKDQFYFLKWILIFSISLSDMPFFKTSLLIYYIRTFEGNLGHKFIVK